MAGRPSTYTQDKADLICESIASSSKSLRTICLELNEPISTIMDWLNNNKEFSEQYARAKELQADFLADEIIEIADDSSRDEIIDIEGNRMLNSEFTQRSKLRVDARKWVASKLKPKKYGDKTTTELTGANGGPLLTIIQQPAANENEPIS